MSEKAKALLQPGAAVFTDEAIQAGMAMAQPREVEGFYPFVVTPPNSGIKSLKDFMIPVKDDHRRAAVSLTEAASFIEYIKTYGDENTIIFANAQTARFTATLDYHEKGDAGGANWRDHTASLQLTHTKEWATWTAKNKQSFNQVDFAEFLEANLPDIVEPAGATILLAATTLQTKRDVNFSSSIRLQDGTQQFTFEETTSEKGTVKLPELFTLGIAPFKGSDVYKIEARLRYRISSGKLTFFYDLLRHEKIVDSAIEDVITRIEQGTLLSCYRGSL